MPKNMRAHQIVFLFSAAFALWNCGGEGGGIRLCEASQYGVSSNLPDNTALFQAALHSCAGRAMHVPAGTYKFAPGMAYPNTSGFGKGVAIPDRTSIIGDGPGKTILQVVGPGNYSSFLWIEDAGNLSVRNLTLVGNNARNPLPPPGVPACFYDHGLAISIKTTDRPRGNISITGSEFISFTGTSWIHVLGGGKGNEIDAVTIEDNYFKSVEGNAVAPEHIVCPASAVSIQGLGPTSSVAEVCVAGKKIDADYIKTGVAVWSGASAVTIRNNTITNAGKGLPVPDHYSNGSYGILIYHHHAVPPSTMLFARPTKIGIFDNEIVSPYSSGIYVAGGQNVSIVDNSISGQVDTYDITEPRGAVALNSLNNDFEGVHTSITDNHIRASAIGISIAGGVLPIVDSNVIESIPTGGTGIKIDGSAIGATLTLTNTIIAADKNTDHVSSVLGFFPLEGLTIDGLYQVGVTFPLRWYTGFVDTPQHPQKTYCSFRAFGSINRVFIGDPACSSTSECWTAQNAYWPYYGVGCS
jgi:hypothetical protein